MALVTRRSVDPTAQRIGMTLAAGLPLLCYIAAASGHRHWLDAGELVASGLSLGIGHPPGQPLFALWSALFSWVPAGPLAFRVALGSAVATAIACGALERAIETTLRAQGLTRPAITTAIAVGASWLYAGTHAAFIQAIRPEVYALQSALCFVVIERIVALEATWPTRDVRPLWTAAFALGLALTNHHFLALLLLPALMPSAARVLHARGAGVLWIACGFGLAGLFVLIYLPLRAANAPLPNLGAPTTLARFLWVVSAKAFQKNVGAGVPEPLTDRSMDVLVVLAEDLSIAALFALVGLYALIRNPGVRRIGVVWGAALLVPMAARAWLGFTRNNPDAAGYLLSSVGAASALAAAFVGQLVTPHGGMDSRGASRSAAVLALAVACLGLTQLHHASAQVSLADFTATDELDAVTRRDLPPRAIVIAYQHETIFDFWGAQAEERTRADITVVPMPFLGYPGMVSALLDQDPDLTDVLRGAMLAGELRQPDLQSLAARRPLLIELDVRVPPALYETLVPAGFYYQVVAAGATDADERAGRDDQVAMYEQLYRRLGAQVHEHNTRERLLWHHYIDGLYYMGFGDLPAAERAVAQARALAPDDARLLKMEATLRAVDKPGPIDVAPFLPALD